MKVSKLVLCILLSLTLVVTFIPVMSFAQDEGVEPQENEEVLQFGDESFPADVDEEAIEGEDTEEPEMEAKADGIEEITSVDITITPPLCGLVVKITEGETPALPTPQPKVAVPSGAKYELASIPAGNGKYTMWGYDDGERTEMFQGMVQGDKIYDVIMVLTTKDENTVFKTGCPINIKGGTLETVVPMNGKPTGEYTAIGVVAKVKAGWAKSYVKKMKVKKGKKSFTVKWKKQSKKNRKKFAGYQIRYSTKADMSGAKMKNVSKKKKSKKIKKLAKKTRYYVQMRSYTKTSEGTFYSRWSKVKKVKTK